MGFNKCIHIYQITGNCVLWRYVLGILFGPLLRLVINIHNHTKPILRTFPYNPHINHERDFYKVVKKPSIEWFVLNFERIQLYKQICINFTLKVLTIIKKYSYFKIKVGLTQNISAKLKYTK